MCQRFFTHSIFILQGFIFILSRYAGVKFAKWLHCNRPYSNYSCCCLQLLFMLLFVVLLLLLSEALQKEDFNSSSFSCCHYYFTSSSSSSSLRYFASLCFPSCSSSLVHTFNNHISLLAFFSLMPFTSSKH